MFLNLSSPAEDRLFAVVTVPFAELETSAEAGSETADFRYLV